MGNASRHIVPAKRIIPQFASNLLIVIPAAAPGKRMKSYGAKSLIPLNNGNVLLEKQLSVLWKAYPKAEVIATVGFEATKIDKTIDRATFPLRLVFNDRYEETSVVHSIALAIYASVAENILIINGDLVFNEATIAGLVGETSKVVIRRNNKADSEIVGVNVLKNQVSYFSYGFDSHWAKIVYLTGKEASIYKGLAKNPDNWKLLNHELLNKILEKGGVIEAVEPTNMQLVEIDSPRDVEQAVKIYE